MRLTGVYFDLTDRFKPVASGSRRSAEVEPADGAPALARPKVLISVAKRLVPSAVQRNTVKRIVREAWREAVRNAVSMEASREQSIPQESSGGSAGSTSRVIPAGNESDRSRRDRSSPGRTVPRVCLVRLKRHPGSTSTSGDLKAQAKSGAKTVRKAAPVGRVKLGTARARRSLRADIDSLFAVALSGGSGDLAVPRAGVRRARPPATMPTVQPRPSGSPS